MRKIPRTQSQEVFVAVQVTGTAVPPDELLLVLVAPVVVEPLLFGKTTWLVDAQVCGFAI